MFILYWEVKFIFGIFLYGCRNFVRFSNYYFIIFVFVFSKLSFVSCRLEMKKVEFDYMVVIFGFCEREINNFYNKDRLMKKCFLLVWFIFVFYMINKI